MNVRPSSLGLDAFGGSCSSPPAAWGLARHVMADGESVHGKDFGDHHGGQPQNQYPMGLKRATNCVRALWSGVMAHIL